MHARAGVAELDPSQACTIPPEVEMPILQGTDCINNIKPDYFALSLSWSPQHCSTAGKDNPKKHKFQCSINKFEFVVHGLWGQNSKASSNCEQPRNCGKSLVDTETIRQSLCTVPGVDLIQGEWQKHGTCTGMTADQYFGKTRLLWNSINKPDMSKLVDANSEVAVETIVNAFVAANANSGLFADAVAVQVASTNYLNEIFICYDNDFKYRECSTGRTPAKQKIKIAFIN